MENPQTRSHWLWNDVGGGRWKMATGLLWPQPSPAPSVPQRAHLKCEIVLLQSALLRLLGFVAPLHWVTPVLSQLCSHLPQLILMRTQLLLLQRQVRCCEVPLSGCHRDASNPVLPGSASLQGNWPTWPESSIRGVEPGLGPKGALHLLPCSLLPLASALLDTCPS